MALNERTLWRRRLERQRAERLQAHVARPVAQDEQGDRPGGDQHRHDEGERDPPAVGLGQLGQQRQEDELPGRVARRQHADDEAAPFDEPAGRDRRAEHQRHHAGADADEHAPQRDELPELGHGE